MNSQLSLGLISDSAHWFMQMLTTLTKLKMILTRLAVITLAGVAITACGALSNPSASGEIQPRPLTEGAGSCYEYQDPNWTPDNRIVAWNPCKGLVILDLSNGPPRAMSNMRREDLCGMVSPDNKRIATKSSDAFTGRPQIFVTNLDGSNRIQLTNTQENKGCPTWSPDGTKIAFTAGPTSLINQLYLVDSNGANLVRLTQPPFSVQSRAGWEPSGERLVVANEYDGQIYLISTSSSEPLLVKIEGDTWSKLDPVWSPDGRWIVYYTNGAVNNTYPSGLYAVHPDGTGRRLLFKGGGIHRQVFSQSGEMVAFLWFRYGQETTSQNIYLLTLGDLLK